LLPACAPQIEASWVCAHSSTRVVVAAAPLDQLLRLPPAPRHSGEVHAQADAL
jgi:hypothetical protein